MRREDWPNDRYLVFRIRETFIEEREVKQWSATTIKHECYSFSFESEIDEINEHMFNKYHANLSESYDVDYTRTELTKEIIDSVSNSITWGEE